MAFEQKTWTARQGTGLNKYTDVNTGQVYELMNTPDNVIIQGDAFTAANMNGLEERIASGFAEMVQTDSAELKAGTATSATNSSYTCPVFYIKTENMAIVFFTSPYQTDGGYTLILPAELQGFTGGEIGVGSMWTTGNPKFIYLNPDKALGDRVTINGQGAIYTGWNGWFSAWCVLTY